MRETPATVLAAVRKRPTAVLLRRLVVDDERTSLVADFGTGLTIAYHENPAARSRLTGALLSALAPEASAGVHAEIALDDGRELVVVRTGGSHALVVDIDAASDITEEFRGDDGRIDIRPEGAHRLGPITTEYDRADEADTAEQSGPQRQLAEQLERVGSEELWTAATELVAAQDKLRELAGGDVAEGIDQALTLETAAEAHQSAQSVERSHRALQTFGIAVSAGCILVAIVLFALEDRVQDNRVTSLMLAGLGLLAGGVVISGRRPLQRATQQEQHVLTELGVSDWPQLAARSGPLGEDEHRSALLRAAAELEPALDRWKVAGGGLPAAWVLTQRAQVDRPTVADTPRAEVAGFFAPGDMVGLVARRPPGSCHRRDPSGHPGRARRALRRSRQPAPTPRHRPPRVAAPPDRAGHRRPRHLVLG